MAENRFTLGHDVSRSAAKRRRDDGNITSKREKATSPPARSTLPNPQEARMLLGGLLHGNLTSLASLERCAGLRGIRNASNRRRIDASTTAKREKGVCLAGNFAYCPKSGSFWKAALLTLKAVLDLSRSPHGRIGPDRRRSTRQTGILPPRHSSHLDSGAAQKEGGGKGEGALLLREFVSPCWRLTTVQRSRRA